LYESMTGKKARKPVVEISKPEEEVKKIEPVYDDLDAYQKMRDAEREAELEKARAKEKEQFKFNYVKPNVKPRINWSIYGGWVNPFEPINKGKLGSSQSWRIEKPGRSYY